MIFLLFLRTLNLQQVTVTQRSGDTDWKWG